MWTQIPFIKSDDDIEKRTVKHNEKDSSNLRDKTPHKEIFQVFEEDEDFGLEELAKQRIGQLQALRDRYSEDNKK